jgi:hypothetical protein
MELIHKKCNSTMCLDFSGSFMLRSPSLSIYGGIVSVDVYELSKKKGKTSVQAHCPNCEENLNLEDENLGVKCMVCGEINGLNDTKSIVEFSCICTNCLSILSGESKIPSKNISQTIKQVSNWVKITSTLKESKSILEVLEKGLSRI